MEEGKKEKKEKKDKEESKIFYLRAVSVEDLCRYACKFDFTSDTLLLSNSRLIALGERIGETQIAYYAATKESGSVLLYEPAGYETKERASFTTNTDLPNKQYINVMRVDLGKFATTSTIASKGVQLIAVEDPVDLVRAVIRNASHDEKLAHVYSFSVGAKRALGAFDVIDGLSNDRLAFFYAYTGSSKNGNFARYDYRNNVLDFVNSMEGHSYMYAKIINLAEPFPFLEKTNK
ncbi:MAG: hypothetical protein KGH57_02510 [Candidatus Micrarchaeota archaeon]|nr:hypothetical protein [Candidatus Micrarchaeota archaeon]